MGTRLLVVVLLSIVNFHVFTKILPFCLLIRGPPFCEMQSWGGGEGSAGNVVKVKAQNSLTKYFLFFFFCFFLLQLFFFFVVVNSQFSFSLWHVPREFISCRRTEKYMYQRSLNRRQEAQQN